MGAEEVKKGIYWVGGKDWHIRNFHGYLTPLGTTYNAYLIVDEKVVLIDTVKEDLADEMLYRIGSIIDPSKIDYIICNHVEMDHSGSIPRVMELAPQATVFASKRGEKAINAHFQHNWDIKLMDTDDTLSIGSRTLSFINTPLVHWPDSMITYSPDDKILFSNDAFGQHLATAERYDDQVGWSSLKRDAAKYYANIVLPYGKQIMKLAETLSKLEIEQICPSHGVIWRSFIPKIVEAYGKWANHVTDNKALLIYDTMWGSTEKMVRMLERGLTEGGVPATVRHLKMNHITDLMTDVLESKLIAFGSPTLNNTFMPTMGGFISYMKGLKPQNRTGFAFGSYGWGGQAVGEIEKILTELKWEIPTAGSKIEYVPTDADLSAVKETGKILAEQLLKD